MRTCLFCGIDISAAHGRAKYCCPSHRVQHANGVVYDPNKTVKRGRPPKVNGKSDVVDAPDTEQKAKTAPNKPENGKRVLKPKQNQETPEISPVLADSTIVGDTANDSEDLECKDEFGTDARLDPHLGDAPKTTFIDNQYVGESGKSEQIGNNRNLTNDKYLLIGIAEKEKWVNPAAEYTKHPVFPFRFGNDSFLNVETYSIYPMSKRPTETKAKREYDKLKKQSDDLIRAAWGDYQKNK